MIRKIKDVDTNINVSSAENGFIGANFYTEDDGSAYIRIAIKDNNEVLDLTQTDMKPRLDLFCSDGSIFTNEPLDILIPDKGIIQYKVSDNVIQHAGRMDAKLFLGNTTETLHVANFYFTITDSGMTGPIGKEIHVDSINNVVEKVMKQNALGLLDDQFLDKVGTDLQNYVQENPDTFKGEKGEKGDDGLKGEKGDTGAQGPQGLQGAPGKDGINGVDGLDGKNGLDGEKGDPFTFADFSPEELEELRGPKGEKGDRGEQGEKGPQGIQGTKGDTGAVGAAGRDYSPSLYKISIPCGVPFTGINLVAFYNQFSVTLTLQGNADGTANNISNADVSLLQLPSNIPRPLATVRGTITSLSATQTTQYTGNLIVGSTGNVTLKFDKKGDGITSYFGGSLTYPTGQFTDVNFNKGFRRVFDFPEPRTLVVQGSDFVDGYIFGADSPDGTNCTRIQVIDTNNTSNNFVTNDLGIAMGHANGMSIAGKIGNEYLLYVAHMYNPTIVPVYVNIETKTARIGTGIITLLNDKNNQVVTSSVEGFNITEKEITFSAYCSGSYFKFKLPNMDLNKSQTVKGELLFTINSKQRSDDRFKIFGDFSDTVNVSQSNRLIGNKYYVIQHQGNTSAILEYTIQNDKTVKSTGNYWISYKANKKRFELESIFTINGKLHGTLSETDLYENKYDNYVIAIDSF